MRRVPKILHYCWFGHNPIPELEQRCIASWREHLPDYELRFWCEESFGVESFAFTREAYAAEKYAFVSDYVRAKVLYEYGGVYLDCDVEVLRNFDHLMDDYDFVCGFESRKHIGTAVMACTPHNEVMGEFYSFYQSNHFKTRFGNNIIANVAILSSILQRRGLKLGGGEQQLKGGIYVAARDVFYPKKLSGAQFRVTNQTLTIHKVSCSWLSEAQLKRGDNYLWTSIVRPTLTAFKNGVRHLFGERFAMNVEILFRRVLR